MMAPGQKMILDLHLPNDSADKKVKKGKKRGKLTVRADKIRKTQDFIKF